MRCGNPMGKVIPEGEMRADLERTWRIDLSVPPMNKTEEEGESDGETSRRNLSKLASCCLKIDYELKFVLEFAEGVEFPNTRRKGKTLGGRKNCFQIKVPIEFGREEDLPMYEMNPPEYN
jgi:hypothetical protein